MSNIYISEPHTHGKVILNTTCGEIEIELWAKETPMACRNFIQLCMEGYYDNTIFHRVVKKFIIQGGDPSGTGDGGDSIYGEPFKMEIHSRLRFNRRGLVAMSCSNNKVDGSQFFFTLKETPELQGNHTIIGTVVGKTIYNMVNLGEGLIDKQTERPLYPKEILSVTIISNPFDDIIPRLKKQTKVDVEPKSQMTATKDYALLSFGDELEEEEEEISFVSKVKGKSAHDYFKHSNLSSETVKVDPSEEIAEPEIIDLAPVIIDKPKKNKERKERINKLKEEALSIQKELISDILKERATENGEVETVENEMKHLQQQNTAIDPVSILKKFAEKIKSSVPSDWFYKPLTVSESDEAERKVFDPDVYNPEKYDLHDPRNPLNIRKREGDDPMPGGKAKYKKTE